MDVQKILETSTIAVFKHWVVIRFCLDHLLHSDYVRTFNHIKEYDLSTQRQHSFLPVVRLTSSRLVNPIVWCDFACKLDTFHAEKPNRCLNSGTQFFFKYIVLTAVFYRCNRFQPLNICSAFGYSVRDCRCCSLILLTLQFSAGH